VNINEIVSKKPNFTIPHGMNQFASIMQQFQINKAAGQKPGDPAADGGAHPPSSEMANTTTTTMTTANGVGKEENSPEKEEAKI